MTTTALPYPTANPRIQCDEVPGIRQTFNSDSDTCRCSDGIPTYLNRKQSFSGLTYHRPLRPSLPGSHGILQYEDLQCRVPSRQKKLFSRLTYHFSFGHLLRLCPPDGFRTRPSHLRKSASHVWAVSLLLIAQILFFGPVVYNALTRVSNSNFETPTPPLLYVIIGWAFFVKIN